MAPRNRSDRKPALCKVRNKPFKHVRDGLLKPSPPSDRLLLPSPDREREAKRGPDAIVEISVEERLRADTRPLKQAPRCLDTIFCLKAPKKQATQVRAAAPAERARPASQ